MELDEQAKRASRRLGDAINQAIGESPGVAAAIEDLRELGYEPNIQLKLEIGLFEMPADSEAGESEAEIWNETETELELTDEDIKTLQKMKISISDE